MIHSPTKLTYARTMLFIGRHTKTGKITGIPSVLCYRKRMPIREAKIAKRGYKEAIGLVSSIGLARSQNAKLCNFWCHCFKEPQKYIGNSPGILLSESDFVDPSFIKIFLRQKKFRWDFFYFTSGGKHARRFKGSQVFARVLDVLCGEFKLNGIIIQYMKHNRALLKYERQKIKQYKNMLSIRRGRLTPTGVAKLMSKTRFGFFPNTEDCSPLIIPEALLRDCPIFVNKDIIGGWKYVNDETGYLFDSKNIEDISKGIKFMMSGNFHPRNEYMREYGYKNTAKRFAEESRKYIHGFKGYDWIGFQGTQDKMKTLIRKEIEK